MNKKKHGFTLVELIVAFAIFSLLMAVVAGLLPGFIKQYSYVQNSVHTDKVGTALLDLVESELSYSKDIILVEDSEDDESDVVCYTNNNLVTIYLGVKDNRNPILGIDGAENVTTNISSDTFIFIYPPYEYYAYDKNKTSTSWTAWGYTENYYVGNKVEKFHIKQVEGANVKRNVYLIEFDLRRDDTGQTKHFERMFQCVNKR